MIKLNFSNDEYAAEMAELARLFENCCDKDVNADVSYSTEDGVFRVMFVSDDFGGFKKAHSYKIFYANALEKKRKEKRYLKMAIYRDLSFLLNVRLPYGCLTGIRPTKLYCELEEEGKKSGVSASEVFLKDYDVSEKKLDLIERIVDAQRGKRNADGLFDLFVFIPFCPTRCAYCSFVSLPIGKQQKLVDPYMDCLVRELEATRQMIRSRGLKIRAVYIGGGTPTSIGSERLERVLRLCDFGQSEFTVEAGRPDTIDLQTVETLQKYGVNRISVNPQTFNDSTLRILGRQHKVSDIYAAYALCKGKFDVNMDLIACLPGETLDDFKNSVDKTLALSPENITVHTLYLKKGSALKLENYGGGDPHLAESMVDYALERLLDSGYNPYYMYRQKYTSGNLENAGYSKPGKECLYNIDIMEEDTSIIACGANAISKKWNKQKNLITRCANYKEPLEYVKNIDLMLSRQAEFWQDIPQ